MTRYRYSTTLIDMNVPSWDARSTTSQIADQLNRHSLKQLVAMIPAYGSASGFAVAVWMEKEEVFHPNAPLPL